MEDDELKALLAANAEETRRQFDELRRHVDETATKTQQHVDETAIETRRYVDESATKTQQHVDGTAIETRRYVDESATETRQHVDGSATETRRYVDESATETRRYVDESATETRRHIDVRIEHLDSKIELVAESVLVLGEKLDRVAEDIRDEMRRGLADTQALVKFSYTDLDRRVRTLEESSS